MDTNLDLEGLQRGRLFKGSRIANFYTTATTAIAFLVALYCTELKLASNYEDLMIKLRNRELIIIDREELEGLEDEIEYWQKKLRC
jgi:hypothetical protein